MSCIIRVICIIKQLWRISKRVVLSVRFFLEVEPRQFVYFMRWGPMYRSLHLRGCDYR